MQATKARNKSVWIRIAILSAVGCGIVGGVIIGVIALIGTLNSDRDKLVALYEATDGANWKENSRWLSDAPIEEWHGVTTEGNGRVVELALADNRLDGEIPPPNTGLLAS